MRALLISLWRLLRGFLGKGDVLTSIEIKLMDPFQAEAVANELRSHGYNAKGWQQLFPDVLQNWPSKGPGTK